MTISTSLMRSSFSERRYQCLLLKAWRREGSVKTRLISGEVTEQKGGHFRPNSRSDAFLSVNSVACIVLHLAYLQSQLGLVVGLKNRSSLLFFDLRSTYQISPIRSSVQRMAMSMFIYIFVQHLSAFLPYLQSPKPVQKQLRQTRRPQPRYPLPLPLINLLLNHLHLSPVLAI